MKSLFAKTDKSIFVIWDISIDVAETWKNNDIICNTFSFICNERSIIFEKTLFVHCIIQLWTNSKIFKKFVISFCKQNSANALKETFYWLKLYGSE